MIETSTIVVRGFEGKRKPPVAIAFVRLDGTDSAIGNYVDGLDLSDYDAAMQKIAPGRRVRVEFAPSAKAASPISASTASSDRRRTDGHDLGADKPADPPSAPVMSERAPAGRAACIVGIGETRFTRRGAQADRRMGARMRGRGEGGRDAGIDVRRSTAWRRSPTTTARPG